MISYKDGYKYQLVDPYEVKTAINPAVGGGNGYVHIEKTGLLKIARGYAWDGPSGPTIDTKNFMRGSLVHDALYQLLRNGVLGTAWRLQADKELHRICREDGMSRLRAWWVYQAVRTFGGPSAQKPKKALTAP